MSSSLQTLKVTSSADSQRLALLLQVALGDTVFVALRLLLRDALWVAVVVRDALSVAVEVLEGNVVADGDAAAVGVTMLVRVGVALADGVADTLIVYKRLALRLKLWLSVALITNVMLCDVDVDVVGAALRVPLAL